MKCVAYCRVSTDTTDQLNSFENQKKHYLEMFEKNNRLSPAPCGMFYKKQGKQEERLYNADGIFADEGISGTKLKNREAFKYMLECAKRHEFDAIFVKNVPRFSRYTVDGAKTLKILKGYNIRVIFEDGNLDSLNPAHEMVINMLMAMAQEESRAKSNAVKFGIRKLQKEGGWSSAKPYGYDRVYGFLQINENEAAVVRLIFRLYLEDGYGSTKIARYLNEKDISSKTGVQWSQAAIYQMIENPLYTGLQTTHKTENTDVNMVNDKEKGTVYTNFIDEDEWTRVYRDEIKIIDKDYFEKVQQERKRRLENYNTNRVFKGNHLLSNILYCGHCNGGFTRKIRGRGDSKGKLGYKWTCLAHDKYGNSKCEHGNSVNEDFIIELIQSKIIEMKDYNMNDLLQVYLGLYYNYDLSEDSVKKIKNMLDKNKEKRSLNFELLSENEITKHEYKERNTTLTKEKEHLESELNAILNYDQEIRLVKQKYNEFVRCLKEIDTGNLTNKDLRTIFRGIYIKRFSPKFPKAKIITYNYNFIDVTYQKLQQDIIERGGKKQTKYLNMLETFIDVIGMPADEEE